MPNRALPTLAILVMSCLAAGCGGGGGGGTASEPPIAPPPVTPPTEAFRIAGTITASVNQTVDGDTNDPAGEVRPNDSVATAQVIPNPITLGGYVNQPGSGAPGRSDITGDTDDYYQVELVAGQGITMLVADYQQADADLYLFDTAGHILDFSIESGEVETLSVPADGTYVVNVFAYAGASNYILAIGNQNGVSGRQWNPDRVVPWQSIIKYRGSDESDISSIGTGRLGYMGLEQRAGGPGRARLMGMRRGSSDGPEATARAGTALSKLALIRDARLRARLETLLAIKSLNRDPQVEYAEPNYRVQAAAIPNDEAYYLQWHYPLIDLPAAWDFTSGSPDVIVAVIDTGILSNHPDLRGQTVPGYDFVRDPGSARDGDGIDPDPEDPGDDNAAANSFHGTHVSGTVAAAGNNRIGVTGVAYDSRVMPLRALGAGGEGTTYDVDQAIRFAAGFANDSGTVPERPADIINLSLGGAPFSQASQNLYREVRAAGISIVASAGNEASSLPSYPAAYDGVISVAAVDAQRQRASYSNTGNTVDVAAPGGNNSVDFNGDGYLDGVLSTGGLKSGGEFGYRFLSGTSMAAPHVSGVIALMKSVNPRLMPADIDAMLIRGELSDDLGAPGRDDLYGYGLINAQRAVFAALDAGGASPSEQPLLSASTGTLNFSGSVTSLELALRNGGNGELELLETGVSAPWLSLSPLSVADSGLGVYRVEVDRGGLADGVYSAEISARSSVNSLSIKVLMSVGGSTAADVGVVYVLLYKQNEDAPFAQRSASASEGRYHFVFDGLPAGDYQVFAGSDADNDLLICDAGEACGSWLTIDQPIVIQLQADRTDVDFPVDYLVTIPTAAGQTAAARSSGQATPLTRSRSISAH